MNTFKSLFVKPSTFLAGTFLALLLTTLTLALGSASARTQYSPGGMGTSTTPIFNEFYDVPGVGDEADFVRVKPKAGGNDAYVNSLSDACVTGSTFNVRTYVHNGADPNYNNSTAVAKQVAVAMNAQLGQEKKEFTFTSTISAKDMASMTDSATLKCADNVKLTLVPSSVQVYSKPLGFNTVADSSVNGSLSIGSRVLGSGDVYACWDDRVIVVYEVKVEKVVPQPVFSCDLLTYTALPEKNRYRFVVNTTATNGATLKDVTYNFEGKNHTGGTSFDYTFVNSGDQTVTATANFTVNGQTQSRTNENCTKKLNITKDNCPVPGKTHLPRDHKDCKENPNPPQPPRGRMPETGAAGTIGLFTGISAFGAAVHNLISRRRK
jgi:hypothetical protein